MIMSRRIKRYRSWILYVLMLLVMGVCALELDTPFSRKAMALSCCQAATDCPRPDITLCCEPLQGQAPCSYTWTNYCRNVDLCSRQR
jgi:hypothetical protein